jgi:hypothetical protein
MRDVTEVTSTHSLISDTQLVLSVDISAIPDVIIKKFNEWIKMNEVSHFQLLNIRSMLHGTQVFWLLNGG